MSNMLKITVTGGEETGRTISQDLFTSLLVGRSRSAAIHLTEPDVSGRHFEFVRRSSDVAVRVFSRNGLTVDGKRFEEGDIAVVNQGSIIKAGSKAVLRIDELPGTSGSLGESMLTEVPLSVSQDIGNQETPDGSTPETPTVAEEPSKPEVTNESVQNSFESSIMDPEATNTGFQEDEDTEDPDGQTQELQTRVGSIEELLARKRQLERAGVNKKIRFAVIIGIVGLVLAGTWFALGGRRHVSNADDPKLPNGDSDLAFTAVFNESGQKLLSFEYPRDDRMKVAISPDSNEVDVVSYLGIDRDVPFHLSFKRWRDRSDMQRSLVESFENWMMSEPESATVFETKAGKRPEAEFLENVFSGFCEVKTQRGVQFVRAEYTRSAGDTMWHGAVMYFRSGDAVYVIRNETREEFWKRAGYRCTGEPHTAFFKTFLVSHWDSPGAAGLVDSEIGDDELLSRVKRELAADRVATWPAVQSYIDTLLVRSWGVKPNIQRVALQHLETLQERMSRFYNERQLAYFTARENGQDKRMKSIFIDCKTAFGALKRDRRSSLVNNPEVWTCHQSR